MCKLSHSILTYSEFIKDMSFDMQGPSMAHVNAPQHVTLHPSACTFLSFWHLQPCTSVSEKSYHFNSAKE